METGIGLERDINNFMMFSEIHTLIQAIVLSVTDGRKNANCTIYDCTIRTIYEV